MGHRQTGDPTSQGWLSHPVAYSGVFFLGGGVLPGTHHYHPGNNVMTWKIPEGMPLALIFATFGPPPPVLATVYYRSRHRLERFVLGSLV